MEIELIELPSFEVAYFRRVGSYRDATGEHWGNLLNWAFENGLFPPEQAFIGVSLDNPDLVESEKCRHDACVTIPAHFDKENHQEIQFRTLDSGLYALYRYYDTPNKLDLGYKYMYSQWLPESEYEPDFERLTLEFNMNNPADDPEGKSIIHLYVPIKMSSSRTTLEKGNHVPQLLYDGSQIDVLYENHDDAIKWFEHYLRWKVEQQETWLVDPRASKGKMTHMGRGMWLVSYLSNQQLPFHYANRGTPSSATRLCFKAKDLRETHAKFSENHIQVSDIYDGPGGHKYFDAWITSERTRITFQDEMKNSQIAFSDSNNFWDTCVRIGVRDLEKSVEWYKYFVGMELEAGNFNEDFVVMSLGVNHDPVGKSKWILERTSDHIGRTDGSIRPMCFIQKRDEFFQYYHFLKESGIEVGEIGGFTERGLSMFHFYDLDGNRFNVSSFV